MNVAGPSGTTSSIQEGETEEATIDANSRRSGPVNAEAISMKAGPSPLRPPSIVLDLKPGDAVVTAPSIPVEQTSASSRLQI